MTEATKKHSGGGFLGALKSAFVEETPDPAPAAAPAPAPAKTSSFPSNPMNRTSSIPSTPFQSIPPTTSVAPDPKSLANLEAKLQASQPPTYVTFMEQFDALKDVIPDDSMRFRAALKASKTTPDALAGAVDQMLQTMQKAADDFNKTFEANKGNLLSQGQASVKSTQDLIAAREQQRQSINEEIASLQSKLQTDTDQIQNEERRLDGIHAGFMAAHATVLERLNAQKSHIVSQPKG